MILDTEKRSDTNNKASFNLTKPIAPSQASVTIFKNFKFNLICYILLRVLVLIALSHFLKLFFSFFVSSRPCFHFLHVPYIHFYDHNKLVQIRTLWLQFSNNAVRKELFERENFEEVEKNNSNSLLLVNMYNICQKQNKAWYTSWFFYFYLKFYQH